MISKYFSREELKCKCGKCDQDTVDAELLTLLDRLREWADRPIIITSGNRCPAHNLNIGGSLHSQHLRSRAADIKVKGKTPKEVQDKFDEWYPDQYGMGRYAQFTHIDSRENKARWG